MYFPNAHWHSVMETVYHTHRDCEAGKAIGLEHFRRGEGGRQRCDECARLEAQDEAKGDTKEPQLDGSTTVRLHFDKNDRPRWVADDGIQLDEETEELLGALNDDSLYQDDDAVRRRFVVKDDE